MTSSRVIGPLVLLACWIAGTAWGAPLGPAKSLPSELESEDTSPPFEVYLGTGFVAGLASGISADISPPFSLQLGPGYPTGGGIASGTSTAFALYLGLLSEGSAVSSAFMLDTGGSPPAVTLPSLTTPNPNTFWITGTPGSATVLWSGGDVSVNHLRLFFSADAGVTWLPLAGSQNFPDQNGSATFPTNLPAFDTVGALVRAECYNAIGDLLGSVQSQAFAVGNHAAARIYLERNNQAVGGPPVIFWEDRGTVDHYHLKVKTEEGSSCSQDDWEVDVPGGRLWREFDPARWAAYPVSRSTATIKAFDSNNHEVGTPQSILLVKYKLADLRPDAPNDPPVILVHGWTANQTSWYCSGASPLINALIAGPAGKRFHPWALEYPNIGSVRHAAFGLKLAVDLLRTTLEPELPVSLVAHSMGGLVCRTYLQGFAVDPSLDPTTGTPTPGPSAEIVTHLATLSSPHLGEPGWAVLAASQVRELDCDGVGASQSILDFTTKKALINDLNDPAIAANHRPPEIRYFLAAGDDDMGQFGSTKQHDALTPACSAGNDVVVDVCSAVGDCGSASETHGSIPFGPVIQVIRKKYQLIHNRMALPGVTHDCNNGASRYEDGRAAQSGALLNDLRRFLRDETVSDDPVSPCTPPPKTHAQVNVNRNGSAAGRGVAGSTLSAANRRTGIASPASAIPGARVQFRTLDAETDSAGIVAFTDGSGEVEAELRPDCYRVSLSAPGYIARAETLCVDSAAIDVAVSVDLKPIVGYAGPIHASMLINDGAAATTDSVVTLSLDCDNANEVAISDNGSFDPVVWLPLSGTLSHTLIGGPGPHEVFAKFRNASNLETPAIGSMIDLVDGVGAEISVTSTGASARVYLDGMPTTFLTPSVIPNLQPGAHWVSVALPGWRAMPGALAVVVDSGATAPASFALAASNPPSNAAWVDGSGQASVGGHRPLTWRLSIDSDPGDVIFYDLSASLDSALTSVVWSISGIPDTTLAVPLELPDSTFFYFAARAIDSHETFQIQPPAVIRCGVDRTSPTGHIAFPAAGSVVPGLAPPKLRFDVHDWGGCESAVVLLSTDGGATYPDTVYAGAYVDSLPWVSPAVRSMASRIRLIVTDRAGNAAAIDSDSLFALYGDLTAAGSSGLPHFLRLAVRPVPTRSTAHVTFELPTSATAQVEVFDISGRSVRRLAVGFFAAGAHTADWDLRDGSGSRVQAGVYFVRLRAGANGLLRRVVVIN